MGLQTSFDVLSTVIEQYESRGRSISGVEATGGADDTLRATLEVPVSALTDGEGPALAPERAVLTDDGLQVAFSLPEGALPGATDPAVTATERAVRVEDDGGVVLTVGLSIDAAAADDDPAASEPATDAASAGEPATDSRPAERDAAADPAPADGATPAGDGATPSADPDPLAAVRDESVPPYDDTAYLAALYDDCETFAEMSDRIEMDVSAETVRRYMIDAEVHDPTSYDTDDAGASATLGGTEPGDATAAGETATGATTAAADIEAGTATTAGEESADPVRELADEQLVTDGLGLASDLEVADIVEAVVESHTMYEVTRRLGTDPDRTRELLRQLNLIDLVLCRANDERADEVTPERVATRIRQCAPGGA